MEAYSKNFAERYINGELSPEIMKQVENFMKVMDKSYTPFKNKKGNPELTKKDLKFFKDEILSNMLETFDLLNSGKLEDFLSNLTEKEREKLYTHKLLDNYDLLP